MARRRRGRAPEVIRRAYRGRARTLQETILSLLPFPPPTPAACRCRGRRCLGCGGSSHLLRELDPSDYRTLLTRAFCVVSCNAPSPPVLYLCNGLAQRRIVRNSMELIMDNSQVPTNVLCNGYDKQSRFSDVGESLCTYAWDLLLARIGDPLMVFLLRFSSILIPLTNKSHHQVTGPALDTLLENRIFSCTTSTSTNQQSCLGDHFNCGHKMKGMRDDSEGRPKMNLTFSVLQPSKSINFNGHNAIVGKPKKRARECQTRDMQTDLQQFHGSVSHEDNSIVEHQHRSKPDRCPHPEKSVTQYTCDDCTWGEKKPFCTPDDCTVGYGKANTVESLLSSHSQEMHMEQVVSPYSGNNSGALVSLTSTNSGFPSKHRKRARLFSWQRRKKRKINNPADILKNSTFIPDDEDCSRVDLQQNSNTNLCHQHLESAMSNNCGVITKVYPLKDQTVVRIPESIILEDVEAINNMNVHPVPAEEMYNGQVVLPFGENNCRWSKSMSDIELGKESHTMGSLGIPSIYMRETQPESSHDSRTVANVQTKSPPNELLFRDFCSSNQNERHNHSGKMASQCFNCLMLQGPKKVATGNQIKRHYIFYTRFSSFTVLPRNHILNRLKPNDSGAASLMKHIFGFPDGHINTRSPSCTRCNGSSANKSECLYHSLLGLLKSLIRNAQHCQHRKLMRKHCLVSPSKQFSKDDNKTTSEVVRGRSSLLNIFNKTCTGFQHSSSSMLPESAYIFLSRNEKGKQLHDKTSKVCDPQFDPIESYSRHQQVVSFIWAVTRSIVPLDLLGDSSTWRALRKNISKFVRLRRFESFCLKQCIHGVKTSCYPFVSKIRLSGCCCNNKRIHECGNGKSTRKELRKSSGVKMTPDNIFFQCWIYWFFSYMVLPIIGANFYVTERESGRHDVFYYPKPVWRKLVGRAVTCLTKQNYSLMDNLSFQNILSKRSFGFSKVRFLPKEKSLRPLANLKAPSKVRLLRHEFASRYWFAARDKKAEIHQKPMNSIGKRRLVRYRSVNSSLRELYVVLKRIKFQHPQKLGSSVFDYNEIYQKLHRFLSEARNGSRVMPQVFIVVADVSKAFDSIDQDMLIGIMEDVIQNDEYRVRRYAQIMCTKKSIKALYDQVPYDHSSNQNNITKFGAAIQLCSAHRIFIDQGITKRIKQEKLHYLLSEHLKHNVLQFDRNFYLQKVGIPQGSLLSSLFCSFYYGHLERSVILPYLEKTHKQPSAGFNNNQMAIKRCMCTTEDTRSEPADNAFHVIESVKDNITNLGEPRVSNLAEGQMILSNIRVWCQSDCAAIGSATDRGNSESSSLPCNLLLRLIDDFLFISTSKRQATSFFKRMRRGFRDYNCFMNNEKFGLNFDVEQNSNLVNRIYTGADGISFLPWSGLLLNCHTMEIQADYTRYLGVHIGSTITVKSHAKPGYHLKVKLCDYMRPKCHPIFYDSKLNSPAIVKLNVYQAFLLCAMKFHCYICSMPGIMKLSSSYLMEIIERSFSYIYKLIRKRMHDMQHDFNVHPVLHLKKVEVIWLGLSAYIRVLRRKQSRHKELLSLLRCKLARHGKIVDVSSHLNYAADDSHSSIFWKLKF